MTIDEEFEKVVELTGVPRERIKLCEDGFWSRGYVIDDGRIVFKFKRKPKVSYRAEIEMLNFVNSLELGISLQKVGWVAPDDAYLGIYGVIGKSIETDDNYDIKDVGKQLGKFFEKIT